MTGTMGCGPGTIWKPGAVIAPRNHVVLLSKRSRSSVEVESNSIDRSEADAIGGGKELENRYGRERCRSNCDDLAAAAGIAAAAAAQGLAQRAGEDVDAAIMP